MESNFTVNMNEYLPCGTWFLIRCARRSCAAN